jgi:hypothetical protein
MTQTLSREADDPLFQPMRDRDPATPGDPLRRLRFHYGQCLSAEDFEAEQRYFVLRQRLHNALLHGVGTVWGLAIRRQEPSGEVGERLICDPGLAIDPLGREIWVPQQLCLDLAALEESFWKLLRPPEGEDSVVMVVHPPPNEASRDAEAGASGGAASKVRRVYVVLRYEACLSDEVPAIPLPCGDDNDGLVPSRVRDSFRLCLEAEAPADPYATVRDISLRLAPAATGRGAFRVFPAGLTNPLPVAVRQGWRQLLLEHALNLPVDGVAPVTAPLQRFWSGAEDAALLLATVDLSPNGEPTETGLQQVKLKKASSERESNPDNSVRAVLPAVQALADLALGTRLEGPSTTPAPFQALGVTATAVDAEGKAVTRSDQDATAMRIEIALSEWVAVAENPSATLKPAVQLLVWNLSNRKWQEVTNLEVTTPSVAPAIWLTVGGVWNQSTTYQVVLKGTGSAALLSSPLPPMVPMVPMVPLMPQPLAGVAGEVVPPGSGRDACLFATYVPPTP